MTDPSAAVIAPDAPAGRHGYIAGPTYDLFFFILAPVWALIYGAISGNWSVTCRTTDLPGVSMAIGNVAVISFSVAHLFIVFFRSHVNGRVFQTHPLRFTLAPIALFCAVLWVRPVFVFVSVLATWWNIYHTSAQSFGFARIYDSRRGNDPAVGRTLDAILNHVIYIGPLLAGATLLEHVRSLDSLQEVTALFVSVPVVVKSGQGWIGIGVISVCLLYVAGYLLAYARLVARGYRVSGQKIALLTTTAICSIWAWGFNPWGQAFIITTLFHALQYFGIVWWSERANIARRLRVEGRRAGPWIALGVFLLASGCYAWLAFLSPWKGGAFQAAFMTVSILHFWYDGFVWSVRKGQIA